MSCTQLTHLPVAAPHREGMLCDQDESDTASWFLYQGIGVVFDGRPFMTDGVGWPLYLGSAGDAQNNRWGPQGAVCLKLCRPAAVAAVP